MVGVITAPFHTKPYYNKAQKKPLILMRGFRVDYSAKATPFY
jgi:hypothetical protein